MNKKIISLPKLEKQQLVTAYSQIRPYRQGGYRIQHETLKNKNIFHNYGHGGSGVSWSYGSAVRIVNLFLKNIQATDNKCAVIGSGVVGLVTALELVNRKYKVQVYSKRIPKFQQKNNKFLITSQIAPGFWFPYDYLDITHLNTDELASTTMKFLRKSIDEKKYSALKYCKTYDQVYPTKIIQHFQNVLVQKNKKVLIDFGNGKHHQLNEFSTVRIDMQLWLKQIIQELKINGVQFVDKQFKNVNQVLELQQKNIFNCTGFGSKYLFNDNKMIPMRGHIVQFKNNNPDIFNYIFGAKINGQVIRIYGHQSRILLGFTRQQTEICQVDESIVNKLINNYQNLYNLWAKPNSKL